MKQLPFQPADILLPSIQEMTKWSVIACDQHTSEPEYWEEAERIVGGSPSTLRLILPEARLNEENVEGRIRTVNRTMREYLQAGLFRELSNSYLYVERTLGGGAVRHGLIGAVDLACYDYSKGSQSLIRATEGTVLDRIPPRVRVRRNAALEIPHVMLLIDDEKQTVIEPLTARKKNFEKCYDFELMQGGGKIRGYRCDAAAAGQIEAALAGLADRNAFEQKYNVSGKGVLLFAVGDGNHSLAAAKECYEQLKAQPGFDALNSPARYALVEVVNIHDEALQFEPIHRVVFGVDPDAVLAELAKTYRISMEPGQGQTFAYIAGEKEGRITVQNPPSNLAVGTLQAFIDDYLKRFGGRVDYIHGEEEVRKLSAQNGNIGFLLPAMEKSELFRTVLLDGSLPRKTFSMGHACDKRYYLEARKLI